MSSEHYTKAFYQEMRNGAKLSADIIVPIVLQMIPARSVVDVGCGDGTWLAAFQKSGINDFLGIDGDYLQTEDLQIAAKYFQPLDLSKPFRLGRRFDLAVSLEVAEHLPGDSASSFIESLTRLAPAVLFSAAIPLQGGMNHINEQWQDVWAALFREWDYLPVDFIRRRVWQNKSVDWWYAQNTILFAEAKYIASSAALKSEFELTNLGQLNLVHPRTYMEVLRSAAPGDRGVRNAFKQLLVSLKNAVNRKAPTVSSVRTNPERQSDRVQSLGKD